MGIPFFWDGVDCSNPKPYTLNPTPYTLNPKPPRARSGGDMDGREDVAICPGQQFEEPLP